MQLPKVLHVEGLLFLVLACLSGWLGHLSLLPKATKSKIVVPLQRPKVADEIMTLNIWDESPKYLENLQDAVLVRERAIGTYDTLYYCPRTPDREATLVLRFPLPENRPIRLGLLSLRLHSFYEFDPDSRLYLLVSSSTTNEKEILLAEFSIETQENSITDAFDITQYAVGAKELKIIIRGSSPRLLYHPTPNDPIGYAGAQLLRQWQRDPWAAQLELWYAKE